MMEIPLLDLKAQYAGIKLEIDTAISRVVDNASFILGKEVSVFEEAFAESVGSRAAVGVASGTAALQLALIACGVGAGDEVITTAHTFVATAEAISNVGARPVFVDIDPRTYHLDPNLVEAAITPRTKALVPVHLYGRPANLDPLLEIAGRRNLFVIEDAAQAHGAARNGRRCGSIGRLACFSFYPGKNLGAYGDAGAVTGDDEKLLAHVRKLRDHGRTSKYEHDIVGFGERMDALHAAVLSAKLPHLAAWNNARRSHALLYNKLLRGSDVVTPEAEPDEHHVYHLYVIRVQQRDAMLAHLKANGVGAGIHYPIPLHRQPAYLKLGYGEVVLPHTELAAHEIISLPIYPELSVDQITYVTQMVKAAVG